MEGLFLSKEMILPLDIGSQIDLSDEFNCNFFRQWLYEVRLSNMNSAASVSVFPQLHGFLQWYGFYVPTMKT